MTIMMNKKEYNKSQLIGEMGGVILEFKALDRKIASSFSTTDLKTILKDKKNLKDLAKKINRCRGRLKKLGVIFDEYGNIVKKD